MQVISWTSGLESNVVVLIFSASYVFSFSGIDLALLRNWTSLECGAAIREFFLIVESVSSLRNTFFQSKICKLFPKLLLNHVQLLTEF